MERPHQEKHSTGPPSNSLVPLGFVHDQPALPNHPFNVHSSIQALHQLSNAIGIQYRIAETERDNQEKRARDAHHQLQAVHHRANQLETALSAEAERAANANSELDQLKRANGQLSHLQAQLVRAVQEQDRRLAMVHERLRQSEEETVKLQEKADQVPRLQKALAEAEANVTHLESRAAEAAKAPIASFAFPAAGWIRKDALKLEAELERLRHECQSLTVQIAARTSQQSDLVHKWERSKETLASHSAQIQSLKTEKATLQSQFEQCEVDRSEERRAWGTKEASLERSIEDLGRRLDEESTLRKQSEHHVEQLAKQLDDANRSLGSISAQKAEVEGRAIQLQADLEASQSSHQEDKATFDSYQTLRDEECRILANNLESERLHLKQAQAEMEGLRTRLSDSARTVQSQDQEIARLGEQLSKETESKDDVQRNLEASQRKLEEVTTTSRSLRQASERKDIELERVRKECEEERERARKHAADLEKTKAEYEGLKNRLRERYNQMNKPLPKSSPMVVPSGSSAPETPSVSAPNDSQVPAPRPDSSGFAQSATTNAEEPQEGVKNTTQTSSPTKKASLIKNKASPTKARPNPSPMQQLSASVGRINPQPKLDKQKLATGPTAQEPEVIVIDDDSDNEAATRAGDPNKDSATARRPMQTARKSNGGQLPRKQIPNLPQPTATSPQAGLHKKKRKALGEVGASAAKKVKQSTNGGSKTGQGSNNRS